MSKRFRLYADGGITNRKRDEPRNKTHIAGWGCILQDEANLAKEDIAYGTDDLPPSSHLAEINAIIHGLEMIRKGSQVRIYNDCRTALFALIASVDDAQRDMLKRFLEPQDTSRSQDVVGCFQTVEQGLRHQVYPTSIMDRGTRAHLADVLKGKWIAFTEVHYSKGANTNPLYRNHERCDALATFARTQRLQREGKRNIRYALKGIWPFSDMEGTSRES